MSKIKGVLRPKRASAKKKKPEVRIPPMVSRVAAAIVRESRKPSVGLSNPQALARAAMRAMRSPTKEVVDWAGMAEIGSAWVCNYGRGKKFDEPVTFPLAIALIDTGCREPAKAILQAWREMIDAALEAKPYHAPLKKTKRRHADDDIPF